MRKSLRKTTSLLLGLLAIPEISIKSDPGFFPLNQSITGAFASELNLPQQMNNPLLLDEYTAPPAITVEFLENLIVHPSSKKREAIAKTLYEMQHLNDDMARYITLALTHVNDFKIIFIPNESKRFQSFENGGIPQAMYSPALHILYVPMSIKASRENSYRSLKNIFRHEMRHVAFHATQLAAASGKNTQRRDCYNIQEGESAHQYAADLLKKGEERLAKLRMWLIAEAKGKLSSAKKKKLDMIREKTALEYQQHYATYDILALTYPVFRAYQEAGIDFTEGNIINMDEYQADEYFRGDILIHKITRHSIEQHVVVEVIYQDPLQAAWRRLRDYERMLQQYPVAFRLYEHDAHMNGDLPQAIIEFIYPEFYRYTNDLLAQASNIVTPFKNDFLLYRDKTDAELLMLEKTKTLTDSDLAKEVFEVSSKLVLALIEDFTQKGQFEIAKTGLKNLISHNYILGEAYLSLARIEYQQKQYQAVVDHYEKAKQHDAKFLKSDKKQQTNALQKLASIKPAAVPTTTSMVVTNTCALGALVAIGFCLFRQQQKKPLAAQAPTPVTPVLRN